MSPTTQLMTVIAKQSCNRLELWTHFLQRMIVKRMVEVGVYKGNFAANMLQACPYIETYYMIDPWRHLDNWNKPCNQSDQMFEQFLLETIANTDFAVQKRIILRGETSHVIDAIPDSELDFAYIDGDHTLRGITIDLIRLFPKIRVGGWIGGDDFSTTIWQHATSFEPTLVFPFAIYFAEAVGATIYALPYSQFLIAKQAPQCFQFIDLTGEYPDTTLRTQLQIMRSHTGNE